MTNHRTRLAATVLGLLGCAVATAAARAVTPTLAPTAPASTAAPHMPDLQRSGDADSLWEEIRAALAAQQYPLACRNYSSVYGIGQSLMLWLAPDAAALRAAPPLETALVQALGEPRARALATQFERVFPVRESYELARRPDLSNMGR